MMDDKKKINHHCICIGRSYHTIISKDHVIQINRLQFELLLGPILLKH